MTGHYKTWSLQRCHWARLFRKETSLKETKLSFASSYTLEIALSGGWRHVPASPFSSRAPTHADPCKPCACCLNLFMCMDPVDLEGFVFMMSFISSRYVLLTAKPSLLFTWRILIFVYECIFNIDLKQCTFPYFIYKTYEGRYDSHLKLLLKRNNRAYELWVIQLYSKEHFIFPWRSLLTFTVNEMKTIDCFMLVHVRPSLFVFACFLGHNSQYHQIDIIKHPVTGFDCNSEALHYCLILKYN